MNARIINRGRGPEIEGTRITIYRVMDFLREGVTPSVIADQLDLSPAQVRAAISYVNENRAAADAEYDRLVARSNQPNSARAEAGRAASPEELKQRIRARRAGVANAGRRGQ